MLEGLARIPEQLAQFWRQLGAAQKLAFASIALIALGAGTLLVRVASQPDFSTLYANLTPEDASSIVDELTTKNIPFRLEQAGTAIQVPIEHVYDLRLELAAKGMPSTGPVGFEVFDDASLAMTPFQQQVHFRRALEGELERTIGRLQPVKWARVHISLPEKSAFQRAKQQPTAAVVLGMAQGQSLSAAEAAGIAQLLAGAVEGLAAEHVTIVDAKGRLLAQPRGEGESTLAAGALDVQHQIESDLSERAQTLLDAALGSGKSVVKIAATIERRRFEEQQERVNPNESAVISTQTTEESRTTPAASSGGVPGTPSNVPGGGATPEPPAAQNGSETINRETLNYDVSRSRSTTVVPMGEIQRLSIAVIVDGTYEPVATPAGQEAPTPPPAPVYKPRTQEEITTYTSIVKRAVGFDEKRGDTIEVSNVAFRSPLEGLDGEPPAFWENPLFHTLGPSVLRVALALLGVVLLITMVLRPALRQLAQSAAPAISAQTPAEGSKPGALDIPSQDAEIAIPISKDQARHVAEAMRQWLRE